MKTTDTTIMKEKEQKEITAQLTILKDCLKKNPMTLKMCRQMVQIADRQVAIDQKNKKIQTTYQDISRFLLLPDRAVKDCKTILSCYDKLIKSDLNDKIVDKVISERSISQASKVISALNYIKNDDKQMYLDGYISSSELYKKRNSYGVSANETVINECVKRLKDDTEVQLNYAMITSMFKSETNNYLESLSDYIRMVNTVTDKRYTRDEAINDIIIAFEKVTKAITSLREAIINKSNTIMEE